MTLNQTFDLVMGQPVFLRWLMALTWMLAVRRPFSTNKSMALALPIVMATAQPRFDSSAATKYSPARWEVFGSGRAGFFMGVAFLLVAAPARPAGAESAACSRRP